MPKLYRMEIVHFRLEDLDRRVFNQNNTTMIIEKREWINLGKVRVAINTEANQIQLSTDEDPKVSSMIRIPINGVLLNELVNALIRIRNKID